MYYLIHRYVGRYVVYYGLLLCNILTMGSLFSPIQLIDKTPMYRVVTVTLLLLWVLALVGSIAGYIGFSPSELLVTSSVVSVTSLLVSTMCARVMSVSAQHESSLITSLLIFFLLMPGTDTETIFGAIVVSTLAITSKYVFSIKKQHIANPVAIGFVASAFFGFAGGSWWVATPFLFIPIIVLGLFVVAKVRAWRMVGLFLIASFFLYVAQLLWSEQYTFESLKMFFVSYPYLFLAFFMLTEPFTLPPMKRQRYAYALVVAICMTVSFPYITFSPEFALVIANIAFFTTRLRQKLFLTLKEVREIATGTFEYTFLKPVGMAFVAGQYMEWMLPHGHADSRGVRRYFTIASSPTEPDLRLACKILKEQGSSYKSCLSKLTPGDMIIASQLAGDFVLPADQNRKVGYIAGGIGITPFRSHIQFMVDTNDRRDTVLFYGANTSGDLAYIDMLQDAKKHLHLRVVPVLAKERADGVETGYIDSDCIKKHASDYRERLWYVSGPPPMVRSAVRSLRSLGVPKRAIIKDYFPGAV